MPRAAMSVATSTRVLPSLKPPSARSRWLCDLLPWIAAAETPHASRWRVTWSARCLVRVNTIARVTAASPRSLASTVFLAAWSTMDHALLDALGRGGDRHHLDRGRVLEQLGRERRDVLGQGGGEEQALALGRHMRHHAPDGVDEADVEHPVDLVQHHHLDPVEPDRAMVHVIDEPARRGDQDVDAARHDPLLAAHVDAAEDDGGGQPQVAAVGLEALLDLARQLARRGQDQDPAAVRRGRPAVGGEAVQDRQRERRGLAGAGLGDAQEVAAFQDVGDRLGLDRRRRGVVLGGQGIEQRGCEAEIGKLGQNGVLSKRAEWHSAAQTGSAVLITATGGTGSTPRVPGLSGRRLGRRQEAPRKDTLTRPETEDR